MATSIRMTASAVASDSRCGAFLALRRFRFLGFMLE
jgi:hypothetical protein